MPDRMYSPYSKDFYHQIEDELAPLPRKRCMCANPRDFYLKLCGGKVQIYCVLCDRVWGTIDTKNVLTKLLERKVSE